LKAIACCFYKHIIILRHHFESLTNKGPWLNNILQNMLFLFKLYHLPKVPCKIHNSEWWSSDTITFLRASFTISNESSPLLQFLRRMVCYFKSYLGCNILHTHCISLSVCLSLPFSLSLSLSSSSCLLRWPLSYSYPLDAKVR
jgi:hypothetical protein